MTGTHRIIVSSKKMRYDFAVRRNLTIIRGDSATGKTALIDMIQEYINNPSGSAIDLSCDKPCYVLSGALWKEQLSGIRDGIVFIDEGNEFVKSDDFARAIRATGNYYVIVTREGLPSLPYSIDEIYGIHTSGKYGSLRQVHHELYHIYSDNRHDTEAVTPDRIITEDSAAGFDFFDGVCADHAVTCLSANGKSNLFRMIKEHTDGNLLVIADGAAFGSEADKIFKLLEDHKTVTLFLPESFEWMILSSEIIQDNHVRHILDNPSDYIESASYFSWEQFFTDLLVRTTVDTVLQYSKKKLNPAYLSARNRSLLLQQMHQIRLE